MTRVLWNSTIFQNKYSTEHRDSTHSPWITLSPTRKGRPSLQPLDRCSGVCVWCNETITVTNDTECEEGVWADLRYSMLLPPIIEKPEGRRKCSVLKLPWWISQCVGVKSVSGMLVCLVVGRSSDGGDGEAVMRQVLEGWELFLKLKWWRDVNV